MTLKTLFASIVSSIVIALLMGYIDEKCGIESAIIVVFLIILLCLLFLLGVSAWAN